MEGKIKLEPRSKRSKNQSWKVSSKREQSEVRFDFAERKELRLKVKVSSEAGGWQAFF